jgi:hypothetical protein
MVVKVMMKSKPSLPLAPSQQLMLVLVLTKLR